MMKTILSVLLPTTLLLSGCTDLIVAMVEAQDKIGLAPEFGRPARNTGSLGQATPSSQAVQTPTRLNDDDMRWFCMKLDSHRFPVPKGLPDGEYWSERPSPRGLYLHTVIKNSRLSQYVETVYPNGQVRSRHDLNTQGEAEGWSNGYTPDGRLQSRLLYRNGIVTRLQAYNRAGRLEKDEIIDCAAHTRTPVAVQPDNAKP